MIQENAITGKALCFTGHRKIEKPLLPALLTELRHVLEDAISNGFVDFYAGGAIGWDTYCAQTVLDLREEYPGIALHLVLPCAEEIQTARWTKKQKKAYQVIYQSADTREFLAKRYTDLCMQQRNQRLIELSDCCVCYCVQMQKRSGTAQTIRMAQKKGIPIINLAQICGHTISH